MHIVQGVPTQTVKSNLASTERKNAIKFNLKVNSVQGRLGIYAWMITDPELASVDLRSLLFQKQSKTSKIAKIFTKLPSSG